MRRIFSRLLVTSLVAGCAPEVNIVGQVGPLVASPGFTDFDVLPVGDSASADVQLVTTHGTVTVVAIDVLNVQGSWFSVPTPAGFEVTPDSPMSIEVDYAPGAPGYHWAEITIQTDEPQYNAHVLQVRGQGSGVSARAYPTLLDLGPVAAGDAAAGTFTLVNEGGVTLDLSGVTFTDPAFGLVTATPLSVEGGARAELSVAFTSDGAQHASDVTFDLGGALSMAPLRIQANDCESPDGGGYDTDGDGVSSCAGDCDDTNPAAHPGAAEVCDSADNDCDGVTDEGTTCGDDDGDGYTEADGDCNDADPSMHPGAAEDVTNGKDDDCDGTTDDGNGDVDHDGFTDWAGDCDGADASVYPGAPELPDGRDNDCDGATDEGTTAVDDDGDGYAEVDGDCDDTDPAVHPFATETANTRDDDCDGSVDEGTTAADDDGDGFTEAGGDCDDSNPAVSPARSEIAGNGIDDDCDGSAT